MGIGSLDHKLRLRDFLRPDVDYRRPPGGGEAIFDLAGDLGGRRVLDLGCGLGVYKPHIESRGGIWIGVDLAANGCKVVADGNRLPFRDGAFEGVLSAAVLEHLPDQDVHLREIHRVLTDGGVLFGYASFLEPLHGFSYFHLTHLGLEVLLLRNGFQPRRIFAPQPALPFLIEQLLFPKRVPVVQPIVRAILRALFAAAMKSNLLARDLLTAMRRLPAEERRAEREAYALILPLRFAVGLNFVAHRTQVESAATLGYRKLVKEG